jgi:phosphoribosylformimino-5-aminoimidazole carboxamide ribotide isomerase
MIVYPAIDVRGGKVVRLRQGDPDRQTVYGDDPAEVARRWRDEGAQWLHVVNLDGTLGEAALNVQMLGRVAELGLPVQFGGGLRSLDDAELALKSGAARVIFGTLAVLHPELIGEAVSRFGVDAVAVALDARGGRVATHGWQARSNWSPSALGKHLAGLGVRHALYTDISRDGELRGVNVERTAELAAATGLSVIASGGVATLADIERLRTAPAGIAGVVIGQALYTGVFTLEQALAAAGGGPVAGGEQLS